MSPDTARQEYQEVCTHQEAMDATMFQTAISAACYHKNRYPNILPLESTRVKLSPKEGTEGSDYINANFIFDRKYIACQAPLFSTIGDFWRMAWEQRTAVIIMLTKLYEGGRVKANLYWPMSFEYPLSIDDMTLTLCHQEEEDNRIVRVILLQKGEEVRRIYHLQYSGWPDFGTPETATGIRDLVKLMFYYRECGERENLNGPVVVHCSAGVGRSGSFIAIAHLLELIIKNQNILPGDVMTTILEMRSQRPGMVQTESQYSFIYQALEEELCFLSAVKSLENPMKKKRNAGWRNRSTEGAHSLSRDISVSTA